MEIGPVCYGGMGPSPISYSDISAWSAITHTHITPWDAHMLRHLSRVYTNEYNASKDPKAPAPYEEAMDIEQKRAAVVAGFKNLGKRKNG